MLRFLVFIFVALLPVVARAAERIEDFTVHIDVQQDGDIAVTETIRVRAEGLSIRRGIFRDLPRTYEKDGARLPYAYDIARVTRDGAKEPYAVEREGNAFRIRIGDADVLLPTGEHVYEIAYEVKNQVRYFADYDEVYWNVTGNYWNFPIENARAVVSLPQPGKVVQTAAYTGGEGSAGRDFVHTVSGNDQRFETTRPLGVREGLTIAVGFEKGVVDPPSAADRRGEWLRRHASAMILAAALAFLTVFYVLTWDRIGRDPAKGPVFPLYEPPEGISPAAAHHIYHRRFAGHQALIAALMNLAVKNRLRIDASGGKKTTLTRLDGADSEATAEEQKLLRDIFAGRQSVTLGGGYDSKFTSAYNLFRSEVGRDFGTPFFQWNRGFLVFGVIVSIAAVILASILSTGWTFAHMATAVALFVLAGIFSYYLPAPTSRGQKIRTEIEGFRLYMKTAEKIYLDSVKPGSDAPPPMTTERYERFLPYAVALGVEEPWTRHFEKLIPREAAEYQPRWANMGSGRYSSLHGLNSALVAGMATGVASAMPQSSSSSGSGGGGFSGGGGGGGGGGGW